MAGGTSAARAEETADAKPEGALIPPRPVPGDVMRNWPVYPEPARLANQQGVVTLSVKISAQGNPEDIQIKKSSNFPLLDEAALEAVRHWHFIAAKRDNVPIEAVVALPINFSLKPGEQSAAPETAVAPVASKPAPKAASKTKPKPPVASAPKAAAKPSKPAPSSKTAPAHQPRGSAEPDKAAAASAPQ